MVRVSYVLLLYGLVISLMHYERLRISSETFNYYKI